jgi:soluble cytochrome b562
VPAADQAAFVADYRAEMKVFIGLVEKLEAALKANDNAAAAKLVEELKNERNEDHKKFEKEKKKGEKKG